MKSLRIFITTLFVFAVFVLLGAFETATSVFPSYIAPTANAGQALSLGYSGTQTFNISGSSEFDGLNRCGRSGGAPQWFAYLADKDGRVYLDTNGSDYDTILAVYTGDGISYDTLVEVAYDDNSGLDGVDSALQFNAVSGGVYFIVVDGLNATTGNVVLNHDLIIPPDGSITSPNSTINCQNPSVINLDVEITGVGSVTSPNTAIVCHNPPVAGVSNVCGLSKSTILSQPSNTNTQGLRFSEIIRGTDFVSAGVGGMRGTITPAYVNVSGVTGTVKKALLYWNGPLNQNSPPNNVVNFNGASITGAEVGESGDGSWGFYSSKTYVADVTAYVSGNGNYSLTNFQKNAQTIPKCATGIVIQFNVLISYQPYCSDTNGVSLLVFYDDGDSSNDRDITIFHGADANFENSHDPSGWGLVMSGIDYFNGDSFLELHVGDGQKWTEYGVFLNSVSIFPDNSFSGNSTPHANSGPGGNGALWDIVRTNINTHLSPGSNTLSLSNSYKTNADNIILVLAVVDVKSAGSDIVELVASSPVGWGGGVCSGNSTTCSVDFNKETLVTATFPTAPTLNIFANPVSVSYGGSSTITWSSTNATSCTASDGWSGVKATSGSQSTGALTVGTTFTLSCSGPGGTIANSVTVSVAPAPQLGKIQNSRDLSTGGNAPGTTWQITSGATSVYGPSLSNGDKTPSINSGGYVISVTDLPGYTESYYWCLYPDTVGATECSPTNPQQLTCPGNGFCTTTLGVAVGQVSKTRVVYTSAKGSIRTIRVNDSGALINTLSTVDSGAFDSTNPVTVSNLEVGPHVIYVTDLPGKIELYSVCTFPESGNECFNGINPASYTSQDLVCGIDDGQGGSVCDLPVSVIPNITTKIAIMYVDGNTTGDVSFVTTDSAGNWLSPAERTQLDGANIKTTNPALHNGVVAGAHVAATAENLNYTVSVATRNCTTAQVASNTCSLLNATYTPVVCFGGWCPFSITVETGKLTRVAFKYEPRGAIRGSVLNYRFDKDLNQINGTAWRLSGAENFDGLEGQGNSASLLPGNYTLTVADPATGGPYSKKYFWCQASQSDPRCDDFSINYVQGGQVCTAAECSWTTGVVSGLRSFTYVTYTPVVVADPTVSVTSVNNNGSNALITDFIYPANPAVPPYYGNIVCLAQGGAGSQCSETVPVNSRVVFTLENAEPNTYVTWTGCDSSTATTCDVIVSGSKNVTVTYSQAAVVNIDNFVVEPGSLCGSTLYISWSPVAGATEYVLLENGVEISRGGTTFFEHTGLLSGSSHTYTLRAMNGLSVMSEATASGQVATCLTGISCQANRSTITQGNDVTWTLYQNGTPFSLVGYNLQWSGSDSLSSNLVSFVRKYTAWGNKSANISITKTNSRGTSTYFGGAQCPSVRVISDPNYKEV